MSETPILPAHVARRIVEFVEGEKTGQIGVILMTTTALCIS
jgi:hypothetical protein